MSDAVMNIPRDVIEPIIQAHVQKAIIEAFGERDHILGQAINRVLTLKVDPQTGNASTYSTAVPWLTFAVGNTIREAVKQAILEELPKHRDTIRAGIARELTKKNSPLIKQFTECFLSNLTEDRLKYRLSVSVTGLDRE